MVCIHLVSEATLEIAGNRFRISYRAPCTCCASKNVAWRQLTRIPEVVEPYWGDNYIEYYNICHDATPPHNRALLRLVEGSDFFHFGYGLMYLEVKWLLERIKEVIGPLEEP